MAKKKKNPKKDQPVNQPEKKRKAPKKPQMHKDLTGFEISINEFGEIVTNMKMEKLNDFLDKNVEDKKLIEKDLKDGDRAKDE